MQSSPPLTASGLPEASFSGRLSWAGFEWARNPYVILVTIYIFSPYFVNTVVGDPVRGQGVWGYINGVSGVCIAVLAPLLGAIADSGGRRKPWILALTLIMAPAMIALWFAMPNGAGLGIIPIAALLVLVAICFEFSAVFHNAMLPHIASPQRIGGLSGLGLALGNAGSILTLLFLMWAFLLPGEVDWFWVPDKPLFGIDQTAHEGERLTGVVAGIWLLVFSLPLFLFTPDTNASGVDYRSAIRQGFRTVYNTILKLRHFRNIALFLVAHMIYRDGKTAILIFGGVYASGIFGWGALDLTMFGILLSIFAVLGGFVGGWMDDYLGSKIAILISIGMTAVGMILALSISPTELFFVVPYDLQNAQPLWSMPFFQTLPEATYVGVTIITAIFITAAYANSRTMMARLAPTSMMTEFFGLFAFSGTATSFLAPATVGFFTTLFTSQRWGFGAALGFLVIGFIIMLWVKEERAEALHE